VIRSKEKKEKSRRESRSGKEEHEAASGGSSSWGGGGAKRGGGGGLLSRRRETIPLSIHAWLDYLKRRVPRSGHLPDREYNHSGDSSSAVMDEKKGTVQQAINSMAAECERLLKGCLGEYTKRSESLNHLRSENAPQGRSRAASTRGGPPQKKAARKFMRVFNAVQKILREKPFRIRRDRFKSRLEQLKVKKIRSSDQKGQEVKSGEQIKRNRPKGPEKGLSQWEGERLNGHTKRGRSGSQPEGGRQCVELSGEFLPRINEAHAEETRSREGKSITLPVARASKRDR